MIPASLDTVEVTTGANPELAVIWLHGLGADGHDFEPIVPELRLPFAARFVFPHAPLRPVTVNGGMMMRAWYDIVAFGPGAPEDAAGVAASAAAVHRLIDAELERGMSSRAIVLAGFSQGGATALHTGLRETRPLGGILALSAYLPLAPTLQAEKSASNAEVALMMAHGSADPVVPIELGEASRDALEAQGYRVAWRSYPMGHTLCAPEVRDISAWLRARR